MHLWRCCVPNEASGIFTDAGASLTIHRTALSRNTGQNRAGGCLAAYNSRVAITTSNFSESRASWRGAGFVFQNTTGTVADSNVFGNSVWHHHGAGASIEYYSRVNLTRVNIHDNINDGGNNWRYAAGINIDMAVVSMFQTNIYNNVLAGSCGDANREACEGGGMYNMTLTPFWGPFFGRPLVPARTTPPRARAVCGIQVFLTWLSDADGSLVHLMGAISLPFLLALIPPGTSAATTGGAGRRPSTWRTATC